MEIIKRGNITFYIKEESIITGINDFQFIAYTVYSLQNRKPFYDFKKAIKESKENELTTQTEIIELAQRYKLRGMGSRKPESER